MVRVPDQFGVHAESLTVQRVLMTRPDGVSELLATTAVDEHQYRFEYSPALSGTYQISVLVDVLGSTASGQIRYMDHAETSFNIAAGAPDITISRADSGIRFYNSQGVLTTTLQLISQSPHREEISLSAEGVAADLISPNRIIVEPGESLRRTIMVRLLDQHRPREGKLTLLFTIGSQTAIQGKYVEVPFRAAQSSILPVLLLAISLAVLGVWYMRRRRKNVSARHN